jgi:hypothetical protein
MKTAGFFNVFEMPGMDSSLMLKNWNRWFSESEIIKKARTDGSL